MSGVAGATQRPRRRRTRALTIAAAACCVVPMLWLTAAVPVPRLIDALPTGGGVIEFECGSRDFDQEVGPWVALALQLWRESRPEDEVPLSIAKHLAPWTGPWHGAIWLGESGDWIGVFAGVGCGRLTRWLIRRIQPRSLQFGGRTIYLGGVGSCVVLGSSPELVQATASELARCGAAPTGSETRLGISGNWPISNLDFSEAGRDDGVLISATLASASFVHLTRDHWRLSYEIAPEGAGAGVPLAWLEQEGVDVLPSEKATDPRAATVRGLWRCLSGLLRDLHYWRDRQRERNAREGKGTTRSRSRSGKRAVRRPYRFTNRAEARSFDSASPEKPTRSSMTTPEPPRVEALASHRAA